MTDRTSPAVRPSGPDGGGTPVPEPLRRDVEPFSKHVEKTIHSILYRLLPLEGYLRAVSRLFFLFLRLGIGRR